MSSFDSFSLVSIYKVAIGEVECLVSEAFFHSYFFFIAKKKKKKKNQRDVVFGKPTNEEREGDFEARVGVLARRAIRGRVETHDVVGIVGIVGIVVGGEEDEKCVSSVRERRARASAFVLATVRGVFDRV